MNYLDPNGYVALVDDLVYALIALTAATVAICSTSFFQKGWSAFCNAVGNGLSSIGNAIWNGASATWNWSKNKVKNAINAVKKFNTAVKSANNIRSKLKKERKNNKRFYTITFNSDDVPILGSKLTKSKVESKLRQGKDVITYYKSDALNLSLIHISEPTRLRRISYAVFCLKKKKNKNIIYIIDFIYYELHRQYYYL